MWLGIYNSQSVILENLEFFDIRTDKIYQNISYVSFHI